MNAQTSTLLLLLPFLLTSCAQNSTASNQESVILASEEFQNFYKEQTKHNQLLGSIEEETKDKPSSELSKSRKAIREKVKMNFEQKVKLELGGSALMEKFPEVNSTNIQELYLKAHRENQKK